MWSVIEFLLGFLFDSLLYALPDLLFYELTGWSDNPTRRRGGARR
jgi:hypothetical protein